MATAIKDLLPVIRDRLIETQPGFWGDDELVKIVANGVRDLWRSTVDLKQEHYLTIDNTHVSLTANLAYLTGVPADVHKIYMIEPRDLSVNGVNRNLSFTPLDYNDIYFQSARGMDAIDPSNAVIYYAIHGAGAPVSAPTVLVAPQVSSAVDLSFCYVPTLGTLNAESIIPIPGEADNALVNWTVAYAMAKQKEDRVPDMATLQLYSTDKQNLLQSLGLREYQEPTFVRAIYEDYWG